MNNEWCGKRTMKNRLYYVDLLRVFFCIAIFAYHIGFLKGGYLAVCSFFALSGYLSALAFKKEKFSVLSYYKSRFLRIYIPMLLVVLCSLGLCMVILPDVLWISMKREVASILLGYNNFWQLSANLDYFARHVDSPYMHLWYVAILLQLELVFPLIYGIMKFLGRKLGKAVPVILCWLTGIGSMAWFIYIHMTEGLMSAYYDTFTRCFAWFMGLAVGMYHNNWRPPVIKKLEGKTGAKVMLYVLIIVQSVLFVFAAADSELYLGAMIATTFVTCRMIDYAKAVNNHMPKGIRQLIGYLSDISYEVFLIQYPVIYMFQYSGLSGTLKYILIVAVTMAVSVLVNSALRPKKGPLPALIIMFLLLFLLIGGAGYGGYRYVDAPDLQAEQERLEEELARQEEEQRRKQQEYEEKQKAEEEKRKKEEEERRKQLEEAKADIDKQIELIDRQIIEMKDTVAKLPVTFVGDSVLLGASDTLYQDFPNCYIDAAISRTAYVINPIFVDLDSRGILGDPIVINCGANGDCPESYKDEIMATLADRQVFWLTSTNNTSANETLIEYAEGYENLHVIDWATISSGHDEYFVADGIHLQPEGKAAYSQAIMDAIYEYYIADLEQQRLELEEEKEKLEK